MMCHSYAAAAEPAKMAAVRELTMLTRQTARVSLLCCCCGGDGGGDGGGGGDASSYTDTRQTACAS
jgi:hypothetical protein